MNYSLQEKVGGASSRPAPLILTAPSFLKVSSFRVLLQPLSISPSHVPHIGRGPRVLCSDGQLQRDINQAFTLRSSSSSASSLFRITSSQLSLIISTRFLRSCRALFDAHCGFLALYFGSPPLTSIIDSLPNLELCSAFKQIPPDDTHSCTYAGAWSNRFRTPPPPFLEPWDP